MKYSIKFLQGFLALLVLACAAIPWQMEDEEHSQEALSPSEWSALVGKHVDDFSARTLLGGAPNHRFNDVLEGQGVNWTQFQMAAVDVRRSYDKQAQPEDSNSIILLDGEKSTPAKRDAMSSQRLADRPIHFQLVEVLHARLHAERIRK